MASEKLVFPILAIISGGWACLQFRTAYLTVAHGHKKIASDLLIGGVFLGLSGLYLQASLIAFDLLPDAGNVWLVWLIVNVGSRFACEIVCFIEHFVWAVGGGLATVVYLVPTIVANQRSHGNAVAILALNVLLGWSFLGWAAALVWALMNTHTNNLRLGHPEIPFNDGKVTCRKCGRRMSRSLICTDGSCQQCYKPSWSA